MTEEVQLDEFGQPIPTQEELDAEYARANPVRPAPPTLIAPPQPTIAPSQQGRMYIGPAMSPEAEARFMQSPAGTRVVPPNGVLPPAVNSTGPLPPWMANPSAPSADTISQLAEKWGVPLAQAEQAVEASERMQAGRMMRNDVQDLTNTGMSADQAMRQVLPKYAASLFGSNASKLLVQGQPKAFQFHQNGTFDPNTGRWSPIPGIAPKVAMDTVTERLPAVAEVPGIPAEPPGTGLFGTGLFARPGKPAIPAVPGSPARTITRRVPVTAPTVQPPVAAPQGLRPLMPPSTASGNTGDFESQARAAIKAGKDVSAVRKRYKELTGRDLD